MKTLQSLVNSAAITFTLQRLKLIFGSLADSIIYIHCTEIIYTAMFVGWCKSVSMHEASVCSAIKLMPIEV